MSLTIIELNDSEIRTANDSEIISRNPGYAVLKPDRIETGTNAWQISRTNPRETSNRFWSQLNQDSLIIPSRLARHNADLAFTQLMAIHEQAGKPEEVLFAVPGSYNRDQLALLLGIVEACPFTAVGLVDSAIASASAVADEGSYNHLDIHLHFAIITTIEVTDQVVRKSVKIVDNIGIAEIYNTCADYFAGLFIDQSRFDPLHHAETEQSLYNQIPESLAELSSAKETTLEINYKDNRYLAKLSAELLLERLKQQYDKFYREIPLSSINLISDRLNLLPGFSAPIEHSIALPEESVFSGCQQNIMDIRSSGPALNFITSLPATSAPAATIRRPQVPGQLKASNLVKVRVPTHVLVNNQAYTLSKNPIYLSGNGEVTKTSSDAANLSINLTNTAAEIRAENDSTIQVNGKRINPSGILYTGDAISIAGSEMLVKCIEIVPD